MDLLTVHEVARLLKVSPITVRRYITKGRLAAVRVGRGIRVDRNALDSLIVAIRVTPVQGEPTEAEEAGLTYEDPLWELVGCAADGPPTDAAEKHTYLSEDLA